MKTTEVSWGWSKNSVSDTGTFLLFNFLFLFLSNFQTQLLNSKA